MHPGRSMFSAALATTTLLFAGFTLAQSSRMDKAGLEVQSLSEVHSNELERRQGAVIAAALIGSWGIGQITGRYTQWRRDVAAVTPGLNNAQGSACHQSGTWFSTADITSAIEHGCEMLGTQSVMWLRMGNERFKNPRYTAASRGDGSGFFDKQGNKITITMTAWNENGKAAVDWINHQACVLAMQTILYDCRGWNPDTRGGSFFYGSDGVAGYSLDPNCVNSPGKPCPRPGA